MSHGWVFNWWHGCSPGDMRGNSPGDIGVHLVSMGGGSPGVPWVVCSLGNMGGVHLVTHVDVHLVTLVGPHLVTMGFVPTWLY